jgi:hypothetical protein
MLGYTGRWDTSEHASDEIVRFEPPKPNPCRYFGAISYVHELMKVSDMDKIMRSGCSSRGWAARSGRTSTDRLVGSGSGITHGRTSRP